MATNTLPPRRPEAQPFPDRPYMYVDEFLDWAGISRFTFYKLLKKQLLQANKIGGRTVVMVEEACRWATTLPRMRPGNAQVTE